MCLQEKVLIVNLKISQWSARKYDKKATREVEDNHNAEDAGRFNKKLIAEEELRKISKIANKARAFHYENTLPWGDNGDRILPSQNYFTYIGEMGKIKDQYEVVTEEFASNYSALKEDAKLRLGSLFNEDDYPSVITIKEKFAISFGFMPIQNVDDIRVGLNEEEVDKIKESVKNEFTKRVDESVEHMRKNLVDAIKHMHDKLSDPDSIFRDTLVTNICNFRELIPKMNFTNDKVINNLIVDSEPLCTDTALLRTDPAHRAKIAKLAGEILKRNS